MLLLKLFVQSCSLWELFCTCRINVLHVQRGGRSRLWQIFIFWSCIWSRKENSKRFSDSIVRRNGKLFVSWCLTEFTGRQRTIRRLSKCLGDVACTIDSRHTLSLSWTTTYPGSNTFGGVFSPRIFLFNAKIADYIHGAFGSMKFAKFVAMKLLKKTVPNHSMNKTPRWLKDSLFTRSRMATMEVELTVSAFKATLASAIVGSKPWISKLLLPREELWKEP